MNVVLFQLPDGRIQRALDRSLNPDQRRILQGLGMDESIYV
ncbi:Mobile element protein [Geobacillus proteiniphilus]|uniref:Mobile element protein n=1 Tax=Geobacillus proteiniphilus TaxID=860353 RepID=A0A1Q5SPF7_9BACL|nr:Mobile element protein [Geobacillus proteiniphilus]